MPWALRMKVDGASTSVTLMTTLLSCCKALMQRHDALQILCMRAYAVHHGMVLGMDIERRSGGMPVYLLAIFSNSSRVRNVCGRSGRLCLFIGLQLCTSQVSVRPCVSLMLDIQKLHCECML